MSAAEVRTDKRRSPRLPREADFWRLWLVGLVLFGVRWIEMLAIAVFAYQVSGSAFTVTMLTMLRILPMAIFGAFLGATTDRIDRRAGLLVVLLTALLTSLTLAVLAISGALEIWHLAVACFVNGVGWATDNSLRRIMIGDVVGVDRMAVAMGLDAGANNASRMVGPTIGGFLLAVAGIKGAFIVGALLYLVAILAAIGIRHRNHIALHPAGSVLARIRDSLNVVRQNRRLGYVFFVTAVYNIFGWPFLSLVPVIGQDNLRLGPEGIGLLASMDGVGAVIGATAVVFLAKPSHYTFIYVGSVILYMTTLVLFALMPQPVIAGFFLFLTGLGGSGFAVMQTTLIYRAVEPQMRARVLGLLSVCIGLGPIGFVQVGLLAEAVGAQRAIVIIGLEGLAVLLLVSSIWRPWRATQG